MRKPDAQVLLVGSSSVDFHQLEELLTEFKPKSYQINWCECLDAASAEIKSGNFSVVLIDCQDNSSRALDLLKRMVEQGIKLPIIALTKNINDDLSQQALQLGATDYLAMEELSSYLFERCLAYNYGKYEIDKKLTQLNLYDPLTTIPNRLLFRQTLEQSIKDVAPSKIIAVLLINIDGFKKINEGFGSEVGDELVMTMAQRLSRSVRASDNVARIGGDEFTLLLDDSETTEDVSLVASKIVDVLAAPFLLSGQPLMVSCSIGIATSPADGDNFEVLLKRANMAMLEAKQKRGSQFIFYSESSGVEAANGLNIETDLRHALRRDEFEMYYQPRVAIESGETEGVEALIRWRHPTRGMVSPMEFIPVAEESGLIMPIGYWIIQRVCQDVIEFDKAGLTGIDVAINLSFKQLQDTMFVDTVARIIKQSGVDASRLEFELTETAIMSNYQQTYEGMMALSELGITFSLDDFGTGFSSFAHIQRLPISALKIDRSFVRNVVTNNDDAIIVKAIINLAHSLRLQVIAEGVETLDQVQFLWQNQCDQVQGFYFSEAIAVGDLTQMINQRAIASL